MLSFTRWERKHSWSLDVVHAEVRDEPELLRSQTAKLGHLRCAKCKFMTFRRKGHSICTASCFHVTQNTNQSGAISLSNIISGSQHHTNPHPRAVLEASKQKQCQNAQEIFTVIMSTRCWNNPSIHVRCLSPQGGKNTTLSLTEGHISSMCVCNKQKMCHKHKPSDKIDVVKLEFMCHQILNIKQRLHEGVWIILFFSTAGGGAVSQSLSRIQAHRGESNY